jgi:hypothetical protein
MDRNGRVKLERKRIQRLFRFRLRDRIPGISSCGFSQLIAVQLGALLMTADGIARRVPWYPTSREEPARCRAPDLLLPVQKTVH